MSLIDRLFPRKPVAKAAEADTMPSTTNADGASVGQRPIASSAQAGGFTPARVAHVLEAALTGTPEALAEFWRLCDYVVERELHSAALINSLALAVSGLSHKAEPPRGDETRRARKIADEVQALFEPGTPLRLAAPALISKGVSHGLAVAAVQWDTAGVKWTPAAFVQKPSHFFTLDRTDGATPLLRSATAGAAPLPLEPGLSLVFAPRRADALLVKNSLGWVLGWAYVLKSITMADQSAFIEAFGSPIVTGKYMHGATPADISALRNAVSQLSAKARAVFRSDMEVQVQSIARSGTDIHEKLCRYVDELISKVVWGSTLTTDAGGGASYALGKVHAEGKYDQVKAYAGQWAASVQRLVNAYVAWNYGPDAPCPRVVVDVEEAEDLVAKSQIVKNLTDAGVVLDAKEIREAFGFRNPDEGAETVGGGGGAGPAGPAPLEPTDKPGQAMQGSAASVLPCGCPVHAQASAAEASRLDELDRLADEMLAEYATVSTALDDVLAKAAASVDNPEDLPAALQAAIEGLDGRALQELFATARAKAATGGLAGGSI